MGAARQLSRATAAAVLCTACGTGTSAPSETVDGVWRAPGIGRMGRVYELTLAQSGDSITGTACAMDGATLLFEARP